MVLVNPRSSELWRSHVVLNGRGRDYHVADFPGPMSIKSVGRGAASWQTSEGRFEIGPGSCVIINDRQPYSVTVESKEFVETLCVFFASGFIEDIQRTMTTSDRSLLDEPAKRRRFEFDQRLRRNDHVLTLLLGTLQRNPDDEAILRIARHLLTLHEDTMDQASKIPAANAGTRAELLKRIQRGRNVMEGSLAERLSLPDIARRAALSPYHFHRSFTRVFRETPNAYLTRRRMERASELLKNTSLPVTEICLACGYDSLGSFSALFRKHKGMPPTEFRRAN